MSTPNAMALDFKVAGQPMTQADFTYAITPGTISIIDTTKGRASVANDIEAVLRKIEHWHQGSIAAFKIICREELGSGMGSGGMVNLRCSLGCGRWMRRRRSKSCMAWHNVVIDQADRLAVMRTGIKTIL
jgi:hypothetical protein